VAVGVAIAAWLRPIPDNSPAPPSEPTYTDEQIADAKANVCEAYTMVKNEVAENTNRPNPVEGDVIGALAVAANGRLALYGGADYLLSRLTAEPATPIDLTDSVRSLANSYKEFGIRALDNEPNSDLDAIRNSADANITTIDRLCK
jgi:hypothetical protein